MNMGQSNYKQLCQQTTVFPLAKAAYRAGPVRIAYRAGPAPIACKAGFTTIWSDQFAKHAEKDNVYQTQTVSHRQHFVDPLTGVQTNNIESPSVIFSPMKITIRSKIINFSE